MSKDLHTKRQRAMLAVLRATRTEAGLTQIELSKKLGRVINYITKIETGERRLGLLEFLEIADALGVEPERLLSRIVRW